MANEGGRTPDLFRVVHVLRGAQGGSFRHVCDLVRGQAARGLQIGIVSSTGVGGAATDATFAEKTLGRSDFRAAKELGKVCRRVGPDIVHGHGAKGAAYARLLAPRVRGKAVYTPHGGSLHYSWRSAAGALYLALEWLLKSRTDGVLFESEYARRTYQEKIGAVHCPCRVVYNGLHENEFAPVPSEAQVYDFVFVGEIRRLKGIDASSPPRWPSLFRTSSWRCSPQASRF